MTFFIGATLVITLLLLAYTYMVRGLPGLMLIVRFGVGALLALATAFLIFSGRAAFASMTGLLAFSLLVQGRIGRWNLKPTIPSGPNSSEVRSLYFRMMLDHDSGDVAGRVIAGAYSGRDMDKLGEDDTRELFAEIQDDADSVSLLETYLDANRTGWREYFEEKYGDPYGAGAERSRNDGDVHSEVEALEVLGLQMGATEAEIRAAHRRLIKEVHPDQGGTAEQAARINRAKDYLLKKS